MPKVVEGLVSFWEPPDHRATPIIVDDHLDPVRHHSRHVSQNQVNPEVGLPAEVSQARLEHFGNVENPINQPSDFLRTLFFYSGRIARFSHQFTLEIGTVKKAKRLGGKRIQAGSFTKPNQAV